MTLLYFFFLSVFSISFLFFFFLSVFNIIKSIVMYLYHKLYGTIDDAVNLHELFFLFSSLDKHIICSCFFFVSSLMYLFAINNSLFCCSTQEEGKIGIIEKIELVLPGCSAVPVEYVEVLAA